MSVRACVRSTRGSARVTSSAVARDGYRGPTCNEKKRIVGGGSTRADKKVGKKYFGGSEGAGETKKKYSGGSEKRGAVAKK